MYGGFVASAASAWAQYPTIPAAEKARGERIQAEINRLSDEAWQRALPVVMSEAAKGRPYVPWASKPSDLKQAKIPAFPERKEAVPIRPADVAAR